MNYTEYMNSRLWKCFRDWAVEFYGRRCDMCGSETDLNVHHWTYKRLFRELIEDVGVYCRTCHKQIHSVENQKNTYDGLIMKWMDKEEIVRPFSWRVADRISDRIERMLERRANVLWVQQKFMDAAKH